MLHLQTNTAMSEKINAEEYLADKICREELGQEPDDSNLNFRKTLVHGMVKWQEEYASQSRTTLTLEEEQAMELPSIEDAGAIAARMTSNSDTVLSAREESFFIAGFQECIKYINAEQERRKQ